MQSCGHFRVDPKPAHVLGESYITSGMKWGEFEAEYLNRVSVARKKQDAMDLLRPLLAMRLVEKVGRKKNRVILAQAVRRSQAVNPHRIVVENCVLLIAC